MRTFHTDRATARDQRREMKLNQEAERRPVRRGEVREARRIAEGFAMLAGEGILHADEENDA